MPPTELYNEGWLLRVALDWFSTDGPSDSQFSLSPRAAWYSEDREPIDILGVFHGAMEIDRYLPSNNMTRHSSGRRKAAPLNSVVRRRLNVRMSEKIAIEVVEGDTLVIDADVLAFKYARQYYGVDEVVAARLVQAGIEETRMRSRIRPLPQRDDGLGEPVGAEREAAARRFTEAVDAGCEERSGGGRVTRGCPAGAGNALKHRARVG